MRPKNQIGYITNLKYHPWGGLNYFYHFSSRIGLYIDWRPSGNALHPDNFTDIDEPLSEFVVFDQTLWTTVTNYGVSFRIYNSKSSAWMIYGGIGTASTKTYSGIEPEIETGYWYYEDGERITNENYNFGILRQTKSVISWQVGYDSAIDGINFGMGFTWD